MMRRVNELSVAGDLERAQELARRCMEAAPQSTQAAYLHGTIAMQRQDESTAIASLQLALQADASNWMAATNLASLLLRADQAVQAVPAARAIVRRVPGFIAGQVLLATALQGAGKLNAAADAAREAVRLEAAGEPQPVQTKCNSPRVVLGEILCDLGELHEAWELAVQSAGAADEIERREARGAGAALMAAACILAGRVQSEAGQYEKALDSYAKAMKLEPATQRASALRNGIITKALRAGLPAQPGDVFIATYPKSGTTWMQQVVCMLLGEPADVDIQTRAPYIEAAIATTIFSLASLRAMARPRIFKTHASFDDLPVAGCSASAPPAHSVVVVVVRDPRDVMVHPRRLAQSMHPHANVPSEAACIPM